MSAQRSIIRLAFSIFSWKLDSFAATGAGFRPPRLIFETLTFFGILRDPTTESQQTIADSVPADKSVRPTHTPLRAGGFFPSQGQKVLCALDGFGNLAQQLLQIFVALHEIDLRRIHDQQIG